MKKFIKHFILTISIFWAISVLITVSIYTCFKRDFYANYEVNEIVIKQDVFAKSPAKINTIFLGGSQVYRQIIPSVFDSLTNNTSYNLGYPGLFFPRSYEALDEALKTKRAADIKNIFIELAPPDRMTFNYNNNPYVYSFDFKTYEQTISSCTSPNLDKKEKALTFGFWNVLLFYKYSGFAVSKYVNLLLHTNPVAQPDTLTETRYRKIVANNEGFVDLNTQKKQLNMGSKKIGELNAFKEEGLAIMKAMTARYPSTKPKPEKVNMFAQYIMDYATHLQQEGKNVYFIVGPRELTFVKYGLAQKRILVQHGFKVFDLSDPKLYPQFYSYDYSFDLLHLNYEGAVLYTQTLANLLKESNGQK